jgi:hypothetical protein
VLSTMDEADAVVTAATLSDPAAPGMVIAAV